MLNRCTIAGRLTRDPELRYTQSNVAVVSFSVAVDRDISKPGEQREADFFTVVAWRQTAEFVSQWFRKGSMIIVDGRLQTRKWQDKQGQTRTETEILADRCYFGSVKAAESSEPSGSRNAQQSAQYAAQPAGGFQQMATDDDDCPF